MVSFARTLFFVAPGLVALPGARGRAGLARDQPAHRTVRGVPLRPALRAPPRRLGAARADHLDGRVRGAPLYQSEQRQLAKMVEEE